jgi:hypothetical protein
MNEMRGQGTVTPGHGGGSAFRTQGPRANSPKDNLSLVHPSRRPGGGLTEADQGQVTG